MEERLAEPVDAHGHRSWLSQTLSADLAAHDRFHGITQPGTSKLRWIRLAIDPYFLPVLLIRLMQAQSRRPGKMARILALIFSRLNYFLFGIEVARQTEIGPGLYLPHTRGTVIGASRIGSRAVIYHGVTLGARRIDVGFDPDTRPEVGDDVIIGSGAKVIGAIRLGDRVRIGPNTVVDRDVASDCTVTSPAAIYSDRRTDSDL